MKRKLLLVLGLFFATMAVTVAQPTVDPEMAKQSTEILKNMRKVELLNQILPLALQKNQILQILPVIERAREDHRKLLIQEHKDLLEIQKSAQQAVDAGMKGKIPEQEFVRVIEVFYKANDIRRQVEMGRHLDKLMPVLLKVLDKGQQKVMTNALPVLIFEPDISPAQASEEQKQRIFCRDVFLDPVTYEILVGMSK